MLEFNIDEIRVICERHNNRCSHVNASAIRNGILLFWTKRRELHQHFLMSCYIVDSIFQWRKWFAIFRNFWKQTSLFQVMRKGWKVWKWKRDTNRWTFMRALFYNNLFTVVITWKDTLGNFYININCGSHCMEKKLIRKFSMCKIFPGSFWQNFSTKSVSWMPTTKDAKDKKNSSKVSLIWRWR